MTNQSKADAILDSALAVFRQYGFHKTSMLDIAQAAGVSRAALYLHFTNKEDVFRSGAIRTHSTVMRTVEAELSGQANVLDRIENALVAYFTGLVEQLSTSPHGAELFDASAELVGDVARDARQRLVDRIDEALTQAESRDEIRPLEVPSEKLALLLLATIDGLKHSTLPVREGIAIQLQLVRASAPTR